MNLPALEKEPAKESTIRIEVELEKTGDDSFPEFSYVALVDEMKKQNPENHRNSSEKDSDVQDLAAYFESKYGNFGNTAKFDKNKRKRRERIEDLMDMGEGYDANDDFIDDSDAHDVFVPQEYDTWHGGFYVNQGKLRFKMGDESGEVNLITGTKKRNLGLKRLDEEDDDEDDEDEYKENEEDAKTKQKIQKPVQSAAQKIVAKAKKTQKVVAPKTVPSNGKTPGIVDSKPKPILDLAKKTPVSPGRQSQRSPRSPARLIHEKQDVRVTQQSLKIPPQPEENDLLTKDCPSPLREKCENLRKIAELQKGLSSQKFFTPAVNQMLLEIEELARNIPQKTRSTVYNYLVKPMPCTRDTFLARIKKMKKESCDTKLAMPHANLVMLVNKLMTEHEKKHKLQKEQYEIKLSEYNEKSPSDPSLKKPRNPPKTFSWTVEVKACFSKLVKVKKELYAVSRPRGVTCEEWINKYLEEEVKSIWPPGWMTIKQLEKMAKNAIDSLKPSQAPNNSSTASSTPQVSSKLSPVVSLTPVKVESGIGQKRKLSEKSTNETPVSSKKKKDLSPITPSAQQSANVMELLAAVQQLSSQNGVIPSNSVVLEALARQISVAQQKSPVKKADHKKKAETKSPQKKVQPSPTKAANSSFQKTLSSPASANGNVQLKNKKITLVPKKTVKPDFDRPVSPDLMITSVTDCKTPKNTSINGNTTIPKPVIGNNVKAPTSSSNVISDTINKFAGQTIKKVQNSNPISSEKVTSVVTPKVTLFSNPSMAQSPLKSSHLTNYEQQAAIMSVIQSVKLPEKSSKPIYSTSQTTSLAQIQTRNMFPI